MRANGKHIATAPIFGPMTGKRVGTIYLYSDDEIKAYLAKGGKASSVRQRKVKAAPQTQRGGKEASIGPGSTVTFTGRGVFLSGPSEDVETILDRVAAIRDEYRKARGDALDQMELNAALGNTADVAAYSSEAERHGAALHACNRILSLKDPGL